MQFSIKLNQLNTQIGLRDRGLLSGAIFLKCTEKSDLCDDVSVFLFLLFFLNQIKFLLGA